MTDIVMHSVTIQGMTCTHCVRAVTQAIPGVREVSAELASGRLRWIGIELEAYSVIEQSFTSVSQ